MPTVSTKQHNFMEMVAHDPAAAKRVGVPQSVGKDFVAADQARGAVVTPKRRLMRAKPRPAKIGLEHA